MKDEELKESKLLLEVEIKNLQKFVDPAKKIIEELELKDELSEEEKKKLEDSKSEVLLLEKEIKERLSDDHIEIYKTLHKFHNNFKSIGNMYRKKNPKLTREVYGLANLIKAHGQINKSKSIFKKNVSTKSIC